jgi:P-type Cu+ transporter
MAEKQVTIPVVGMSCASCASAVERALSDVPGVWSVTVNAAGGSASVTYDSVVLDVSDLVAAVSAAGY